MITIRRCQTADVPDVLAFLEAHWKPGHIFTRDRELFDWQYARQDRPGEYSIALARKNGDGELVGMLGYLPTRRFDPALADNNAIWLALWKVREDIAAGPIGLQLLNDVTAGEPHASIGVIGFQPAAAPIYTALKFQVGELHHYVLSNPDVSAFELASFERRPNRRVPDTNLTAVAVDDTTFSATVAGLDLGSRDSQLPHKTPTYFRSRYLQHPRYRYETFVLRRDDRPIALLATRLAAHGKWRALRVVDFIGADDLVPALGRPILDQVRHHGAEYADVLNWGIDPGLFEAAGFSAIDPSGPDIVPNHFEPFERRNASVRFALKADRPAVLFKGDGDQDRPNQHSVS
jgi:hypothetical protein